MDAVSVNKTLIPEITTNYIKGSSTGKLVLKFADNQEGTSVVNVTVKDNGGIENGGSDTKTMSFNVNIVTEDNGPKLSSAIPNQITHPGGHFQDNLSTLFTTASGNTITYTVTLADGSPIPSWLILNPATGVLSGTAPSNALGNLLLTVTATDNNNLSTKGNFWFVVTSVNSGTLSGSVLSSNIEVTDGVQLVLLSVGSNNQTTVVNKFDLNGGSMFMFSGLPSGSYLIKAVITDTNMHPSLLNTYNLNTSSLTTATKLIMGSEDNTEIKIEMLQKPTANGSYSISGKVVSKQGPASANNTTTGLPLEGVDVVLKSDGIIVANTVTDAEGNYTLSSLLGKAYLVEVEQSGFIQSNAVPLTLSAQNTAPKNVNFTIWTTGTITNVDKLIQNFEVSMYPNPSNGPISIKALQSDDYTIDVYNLTGKLILHKNYISSNLVQLNLAGNTSGIYLIKISNQESSIVKKLILKN